MAKAKILAKPVNAQHTTGCALTEVSEVPTGDTIPTPDNVPAVWKKTQQIKFTTLPAAIGPPAATHLPPGSPTKPTTESMLSF